MKYYKLRISLKEIKYQDALATVIALSPDVHMIAHEAITSPNPHIHSYIESRINNSTIRSRLRKLGCKGNGSYSLTLCDYQPIEYLAYMLKEDPDPVYTGICSNLVNDAYSYDLKVKEEIKRKQELKKKGWKAVLDSLKTVTGYEMFKSVQISGYILRYFIDNNILFNEQKLITYTTTIYAHISPKAQRKLQTRINKKLSYLD